MSVYDRSNAATGRQLGSALARLRVQLTQRNAAGADPEVRRRKTRAEDTTNMCLGASTLAPRCQAMLLASLSIPLPSDASESWVSC
jgi:hypothetical protein